MMTKRMARKRVRSRKNRITMIYKVSLLLLLSSKILTKILRRKIKIKTIIRIRKIAPITKNRHNKKNLTLTKIL